MTSGLPTQNLIQQAIQVGNLLVLRTTVEPWTCIKSCVEFEPLVPRAAASGSSLYDS